MSSSSNGPSSGLKRTVSFRDNGDGMGSTSSRPASPGDTEPVELIRRRGLRCRHCSAVSISDEVEQREYRDKVDVSDPGEAVSVDSVCLDLLDALADFVSLCGSSQRVTANISISLASPVTGSSRGEPMSLALRKGQICEDNISE